MTDCASCPRQLLDWSTVALLQPDVAADYRCEGRLADAIRVELEAMAYRDGLKK
jgi:hypothetical protein